MDKGTNEGGKYHCRHAMEYRHAAFARSASVESQQQVKR
jgi:hypothetical protein